MGAFVPNGGHAAALLTAALLCAAPTQAQETAPPERDAPAAASGDAPAPRCTVAMIQSGAGCPAASGTLPLTIGGGHTLELPAAVPRGDAATFRLLRNVTAVSQSQSDIAASTLSFGSTWRMKAGIRFDAPGDVQLSFGATLRRGYSLPIAVAQPLGSDVQAAEHRNSSSDFGWSATVWDTELRIRKALTTAGPFDVAVVGEAFNLLNLNTGAAATPQSSTLTSRTVRVGLDLGF